jgi:uncharacterized membrane protein YebE (DUF533 family)
MFDARSLIDQLMQAGMARSTPDRVRHAVGPDGLGQADNPLAQLFGGAQGAGGLGGLAETAKSWLGQAGDSGQSGNPLAIGGLGALAGAFLGGGMKGALRGGGLALIGSLAYSALMKSRGQAGTPAATPEEVAKEAPLGLREPQTPAEEQELQGQATLLVKAMVNAAKADGAIDGAEMQRIAGEVQGAGADAEARDFLISEMQKPLDLEGLIRAVPNSKVGVEVYAASLLAIEVDTEAERDYLRRLAQGLGLNREAIQRIHQALGVAPVA